MKPRWARLKTAVTYIGFSAGWSIVRRLPAGLASAGFNGLADLAWRARVKGVAQLERNLARVRPDDGSAALRALSRAGMRTYFRYWCEAFRLPDLTPERIRAAVVTHDEPLFWKAVEEGKGVVAALPHMGNWDLAGAWAATSGVPVTAVAERLRPERLFDRFVAYREAIGIEVIPLRGGPDPMPILVERLRAGRLVCLVSDRDLSSRGVEVNFFGEPTRMPAGPAALAVRTGACLMPVTMWYDGPDLHIRFHEPVRPAGGRGRLEREPTSTWSDGRGDEGAKPAAESVRSPRGAGKISELTQAVADVYAGAIADHPQDWHMLQRLWLADLEPR